ncbi:MAG TPA: S1/P1 nuclease, partial [Opitutaceae bacterium]|nr:S1/P1 nuclease [Opitutaceae bacterium]
MKRLLVVMIAMGVSTVARGFSEPEHDAIWINAKKHLNAAAADMVAQLLGNESTLKTACWADFIRLQETKPGPHGEPPKTTMAEIESVKATPAFAQSDDWHFVDLPLGTKAYAYPAGIPSTGPNDVVHGLQTCIDLLEKPDNSPGRIVHVRALRFIVHLVGDIHQPLHVACAYWAVKNGRVTRIDDPQVAAAGKVLDDKGGNQLLTSSTDQSKNLHHDWDDEIPRLAVKTQIAAAEAAAKKL